MLNSLTDYSATPSSPETCGNDIAPEGWWCSRKKGHEGPCAALPETPAELEQALYGIVACVLAGELEIGDAKPESIRREFFEFHAERVNAALDTLRALYTRQREEIERQKAEQSELADRLEALVEVQPGKRVPYTQGYHGQKVIRECVAALRLRSLFSQTK